MAYTQKYLRIPYDHLSLMGRYKVVRKVKGQPAKEVAITLTLNAIIVLERIISFEGTKDRKGNPCIFHMTDEQLSDQFGFSINTASTCIRNLRDVGLIQTEYKLPQHGYISRWRKAWAVHGAINHLVAERIRTTKGAVIDLTGGYENIPAIPQ